VNTICADYSWLDIPGAVMDDAVANERAHRRPRPQHRGPAVAAHPRLGLLRYVKDDAAWLASHIRGDLAAARTRLPHATCSSDRQPARWVGGTLPADAQGPAEVYTAGRRARSCQPERRRSVQGLPGGPGLPGPWAGPATRSSWASSPRELTPALERCSAGERDGARRHPALGGDVLVHRPWPTSPATWRSIGVGVSWVDGSRLRAVSRTLELWWRVRRAARRAGLRTSRGRRRWVAHALLVRAAARRRRGSAGPVNGRPPPGQRRRRDG
jgi:hypothetical protein